MGTPLNLNLRLDTRKIVLDKLQSNGFAIDKYIPLTNLTDWDIEKIDEKNIKLKHKEAEKAQTNPPSTKHSSITKPGHPFDEKSGSSEPSSLSPPDPDPREAEEAPAPQEAESSPKLARSIGSITKTLLPKIRKTLRQKNKVDYKKLHTGKN